MAPAGKGSLPPDKLLLMQTALAALGDCEALRSGPLDQPANTLSSLAFVLVAAVFARRRPLLAFPTALVGVGSFLYHAYDGAWAEWAHDLGIAWLLVAVVLERSPLATTLVGAALALAFAVAPGAAEPVTLAAAATALGAVLWRRPAARAVVVFAAAALAGLLSRTGGPLCNPDSWLQGHAVWHAGTAIALLVWIRSETAAARPLQSASSALTANSPSE